VTDLVYRACGYQTVGCYALFLSCLVQPVDRFNGEGWFSSDQVIFLAVFRVFGEKACSV